MTEITFLKNVLCKLHRTLDFNNVPVLNNTYTNKIFFLSSSMSSILQ